MILFSLILLTASFFVSVVIIGLFGLILILVTAATRGFKGGVIATAAAAGAVLVAAISAAPGQEPNWYNLVLSLLFYSVIGPGLGRTVDIIRNSQSELGKNEQKYRLFFQRSPLAVVHYDLNGIITDVNENLEKIADTTRDKLVGLSLLAFPDQRVVEAVKKSLSGSVSSEESIFYAFKSKKKSILRGLFSPIYNESREIEYGVAFIEDITEVKLAEEALKSFRTALDSSPDAVFIINRARMRFTDVNTTACDELGYSCEELLQMGPQDIKPLYTEGELSSAFDSFIAEPDRKGIIKTVHQRKNGETYPVEVYIQPFKSEGEYYLTAVARDITRQQQAENELIRAKEKAELFALAKSRFLSNMSHTIRTPMHVVVGMSELLYESLQNSESKDIAAMIGQSANSLLGIINDILDYSRIEAGQDSLVEVDFNLHRELEKTVSVFSLQAYQKALQLNLEIAPGVPEMLKGDPVRLRLILINLLSNALKYTEEGSVDLKVSRTEQLPGADDKEVLLFQVCDTGSGIELEKIDLLFTSFHVLDYSNTREVEGSGLGLATSKELVEMMGGTISVESMPGQGSTFSCRIPFSPVSGDIVQDLQKKNRLPGRTSSSARKDFSVLLVEDKPMNQKLTRMLLEQKGWSVQSAYNGLEAVELFQKHAFDLVIMDIQMPKMDGLQATAQIRLEEARRGGYTPIIAMTAYAEEDDRSTFIKAGMDDLIRKPVGKEELYAAIENLVGIK